MAVAKELIKKFAIEFATTNKYYPLEWWGKKYGVTGKAISRWLQQPEVKEIVDRETVTFTDKVVAKARKNVDMAMRELKRIVKSEKMTDVKRRACLDMLGIAKIENIKADNTSRKKEAKNYLTMSNRELEKEYDKLLSNSNRKKTDIEGIEKSTNETIN